MHVREVEMVHELCVCAIKAAGFQAEGWSTGIVGMAGSDARGFPQSDAICVSFRVQD